MSNDRRAAILSQMALSSVLVDDNSHFLTVASDLLERGGMRVLGVASTGPEGIRMAGELRPDVILVDIDLGEESGFDVARELARSASGNGPAIVLISAYPERDFADLIAESPAIGFVPKPQVSADRISAMLAEADRPPG